MVLGTVYPAYARWSVGTAGGGVAAAAAPSCTTDNDGELVTIVSSEGATSGQDIQTATRYRAQQVIIGAQSTITEYIFKAKDTAGVGNVVVSLFTNSSSVPGSEVANTSVTIGNASIGSEPEVITATLASPKTGLASGTYWLVFRGDNESGNFSIYVDESTPDATVISGYDLSYPSSWSTLTDRDYYVVIMGCAE